jgi:hypothetical protein
MANNGTVAVVAKRPACDFGCGYEAKFDGRTVMGAWAYMCVDHWTEYGVGKLGTGYGQKLALATKEGGE